MNIKELSRDECIQVNGGNEVTEALLTIFGFIAGALYSFSQGAAKGGYAACKCP